MAAPAAAPVGSAGVVLWPTRWTLPDDLHGGEAMSGSQIPASVWLARIVDAPRTRGKRRLRVCVAPVSRHLCANRGNASRRGNGPDARSDTVRARRRRRACGGLRRRPSAAALVHKMATKVRDGARRDAGSGPDAQPDTARNTAAGTQPVRQGAGQARGATRAHELRQVLLVQRPAARRREHRAVSHGLLAGLVEHLQGAACGRAACGRRGVLGPSGSGGLAADGRRADRIAHRVASTAACRSGSPTAGSSPSSRGKAPPCARRASDPARP